MLKSKLVLPVVLTSAVLLVGCVGTNFKWDNARQVQVGDTTEVLVQKMGKAPYLRSVDTDGIERWNWTHATGFGAMRTINFRVHQGKVIEPLPVIPEDF